MWTPLRHCFSCDDTYSALPGGMQKHFDAAGLIQKDRFDAVCGGFASEQFIGMSEDDIFLIFFYKISLTSFRRDVHLAPVPLRTGKFEAGVLRKN